MAKYRQFNLLEIATVSDARVQKFDGEKQYVATGDVDLNRVTGGEQVTYSDRPSRADLLMRRDDVLFAKMKETVKVIVGSPEVEDLIFSTGFYILTPKKHISKKYLYFYILGNDFNRQKDLYSSGATMAAIGNEGLRRITISLPVDSKGIPDIHEQERIVALLENAEELKRKRAEANQRMNELIPSLFYETLSKTDYDEKTIGELLEINWLLLHKDGNHGSLYPRSNDFGTEGVAFLSAVCITEEGVIDQSKVKRLSELKATQLRHGWLERGDILLAHNATVGRVGYYDGEFDRALIGTSLTAFRANSDRINPRFLWVALRSEFFQLQLARVMEQGLRNQVPITMQRKLMVRIPPMSIQNQLADDIKIIIDYVTKQKESAANIEALFLSLLSRAFTA